VTSLTACELIWRHSEAGEWLMEEKPGSEFTMRADLVLLALGFVHPVHNRLLDDLGVTYDARGNVWTDENHLTNVPRVYAAGDVTEGASLVVHAIAAGKRAAGVINRNLAR
jgi:glutamate synthase (NADPH) small chain